MSDLLPTIIIIEDFRIQGFRYLFGYYFVAVLDLILLRDVTSNVIICVGTRDLA